MKRLFNILFIVGIVLAAIPSCTIETSDNGKLDGFWHLVEIDTLQTGGQKNLSNEKLFWGVEAKLLHLQGADSAYYLRFNHTNDSLILYSPYLDHGHMDKGGGDIALSDPQRLHVYGIQNLEEHFKVEALSGSKMILKSSFCRLYLKKF